MGGCVGKQGERGYLGEVGATSLLLQLVVRKVILISSGFMLTEPGRVTPTPTPLATTPNQYILPKKESLEKEEEETDEWMWYPCDFIINEIIDGEKVFRSLKPSVELVSDRQPERTINIALKVTMEKDFEHNDEEGWAWHKSWIIPTIKVSVITSTGRKANQLFPSSAFFQIRVVKASCKNPDRMFLLNVGVQGISTIAASTGSAVFQGLKFLTTSYKNEVIIPSRRGAGST